MAMIVFFEDKNFQGQSYECRTDCPDLRSYLSRCNSIKVDSGCWVLYEHPNYTGNQYILSPGEYLEHQQWMGFNDTIKSCRSIKNIVFYEDRDFHGKSYDCKGDSSDLHGYIRRCNSVKVEGGWWVLYERSNFMGYQYVIGPGEYNNYHCWMGFNDCVRSCRIIKNAKGPCKLRLFEWPNFDGKSLELTENVKSVQDKWFRHEVQSCKVLEGSWVFFEHPNFCGRQYLLEKGEYRNYSEWGALQAIVASIKRIMEL